MCSHTERLSYNYNITKVLSLFLNSDLVSEITCIIASSSCVCHEWDQFSRKHRIGTEVFEDVVMEVKQ